MIDPQLLAQIKQLEIKTKRVINAPFMGNYTSVFKGQGMQFSEIRPYHIGDDVRRIDWNITAKRQSPYVKVFDEERELTAIIMLDISGSQSFGSQAQSKRALASEIAALLGFSANQHNDNVGLCLFTDQIERFHHDCPRGDRTRSRSRRSVEDQSKTRSTGRCPAYLCGHIARASSVGVRTEDQTS